MNWLRLLNIFLMGVILALVSLSIIAFCHKPQNVATLKPHVIEGKLPRNPFALVETTYQSIGEGPFALHWQAPKMQLPDLRQELIFWSRNCRPDNQKGKSLIQAGLRSSGERASSYEKQRLYLVYKGCDKTSLLQKKRGHPSWDDTRFVHKGEYVFSPDNQPTPLWCEFKTSPEQNDTIEMRVFLIDEKGVLVTSPQEHSLFNLHIQEEPKAQFLNCEIGGFRADPTLLVRQKARWVGKDLFFEVHGGEEYAWTIGKERIDFLNENASYSCFVQTGDFLIWDGNRWRLAEKGESTLDYPLLVISKIEDKLMSVELWDTEGKGRMTLNLIRGHDMQGFPNMDQEFKFVGAKTWAQFIVECQGQRMTVKLNEWILLTQNGWKKLETIEDIDDYVDQKINGVLFVVDSVEKENGRQFLAGHLFNITRTEMQPIKITSTLLTTSMRQSNSVSLTYNQNNPVLTAEDE